MKGAKTDWILEAASSQMRDGASPAEVRDALIRDMGHIASERDIRQTVELIYSKRSVATTSRLTSR